MTSLDAPAPPPPGGRLARFRAAVLGWVRAELDSPLLRNAYALMLNSGGTAALGAVYWLLAARLYSPADVGRGSAAIALMMLLAGLVPFNLPRALTRLIPLAGTGASRLVVRSYVFTAVCAALAAVVFLAVAGQPDYLGSTWSSAVWFGVAVAVWGIFNLQDVVLTGLRSAVWVPIENAVFGVAKLGLLVWLATLLPQQGVFVSWTIPVLLSLVPVNLLIFSRLIPRYVRKTGSRPPQRLGLRQMGAFLTGDYVGELATLASITLLPILVVQSFGEAANAYFYVAFQASLVLGLAADNIAASLTVEGSLDGSRLSEYLRHTMRRLMAIIVPLTAVFVFGAGLILSVYGRDYAEGATTVLRLVALAVVPKALILLYLGAARARGQGNRLALVQVVLATLALGLALALMGPLGVNGVAVAWLVSHVVVAAGILPGLRRYLRSEQPDGVRAAP